MRVRVPFLAGTAAALLLATPAAAIPGLQLFIEDSVYNHASQDPNDPDTWAKVGIDSFRLWVIVNPSDPDFAKLSNLSNIFFVSTWEAAGNTPSLTFTPVAMSTEGANAGFDAVTPDGVVVNGPLAAPAVASTHPVLPPPPPNPPLGSHGMFEDDRLYAEWDLGALVRDQNGDLVLNTQIADFFPAFPDQGFPGGFPTPDPNSAGQIYVYDVLVSGLDPGEQVHFDVYILGTGSPHAESAIWAPPSHDARWEQALQQVPEPATLGLFGGALLVLGVARRRFGFGRTAV